MSIQFLLNAGFSLQTFKYAYTLFVSYFEKDSIKSNFFSKPKLNQAALCWSHDLKMADDSKIEGCAVLAKSLKDQVFNDCILFFHSV